MMYIILIIHIIYWILPVYAFHFISFHFRCFVLSSLSPYPSPSPSPGLRTPPWSWSAVSGSASLAFFQPPVSCFHSSPSVQTFQTFQTFQCPGPCFCSQRSARNPQISHSTRVHTTHHPHTFLPLHALPKLSPSSSPPMHSSPVPLSLPLSPRHPPVPIEICLWSRISVSQMSND